MCLYCKHMKPIVRIKKINGKEYWYEDAPYYDPEKKQIRHKSRYLGKNINGTPVKVRTEGAIGPSIAAVPKQAYTSGNLLPLQKILQEFHIDEYLGQLSSEREKDAIIALALNRVLRPVAMHLVAPWYEESALALVNPELPLSSQAISTLLSDLGTSGVPEKFMQLLVQEIGTKSTLVYDITSLSSYSKFISLLEYGYNRDGLDLPQVNFSVILDATHSIPVMYDIYPGSIVDVVTLKNTLDKIRACGVKEYTLVLDRGFFSQGNLEGLVQNEVSFVIPASFTLKAVKELLSEAQRDLEHPQYLQKYQKEPIFVKPVTLQINGTDIAGFCYYDLKREQDERHLFYIRLHDVKQKLEHLTIPSWRKPDEVFKERAGDFAQYFSWQVQGNQFLIEIRKNAVSQRINRMGMQIILSHGGRLDWKECLMVYRERDCIEKTFRMLKHDLQVLPMNVKKEATMRGFIFVTFISLILRMKLLKQMKDTDLLEEYTLDGLLLELAKIKKIRLANGEVITIEVSKKQRTILQALGLCA
jgi:transposase